MGTVPKRSEERRRRNKVEVDSAPGFPILAWPMPDPEWHPIARNWFASLGISGQAVWFQPSDLGTARYVAEAMSRSLAGERMSAQLFAGVLSGMSLLLATEADRRRMRIELERGGGDVDEEASVTALDRYRGSVGA